MRFYGDSEPHVLDYTFDGDQQDISEVRKTLAAQGLDAGFSSLFEMKVGHIQTTEDYENAFRMDSVTESISRLEDSEEKHGEGTVSDIDRTDVLYPVGTSGGMLRC